ncbi:unnamed protein product [Schistosoma turkestanicum]|nr:unnamed protein product [Schistosoma turkestanicum]
MGFQDLMAHTRKLELEKIDLQQECEDLRLKVEQQLSQLREFKERRIKCSEIEELKSKLRDVEAQLFQQLRERELIEKDIRQQHEMSKQLKLQQSVMQQFNANSNTTTKCNNNNHHLDDIEYGEGEEEGEETKVVNQQSTLNNSCQDLSILKPGENLGTVLEADLKSARLFISKLQSQFDEELGSARQLLEEKTKRLCELEKIINNQVVAVTLTETTDVTTQTEELSYPITTTTPATPSPDELFSPELLPSLTVDAASAASASAAEAAAAAAAADRRGLSNELIRLHEEMGQSKTYACELEQRLTEMESELQCTKEKLIYQTTLSNRHQQNWILIEQEYRELQRQHRRLLQTNCNLSIEQNTQHSSANHDETKMEFDTACMNYVKQIDSLNQQLIETTFECRRLEAERTRVAERNSDLQRELETTRILVNSLKQQNSQCKKSIEHLNHSRKSAPIMLRNHHHHHQYFPTSIPNGNHNADVCDDNDDDDHHRRSNNRLKMNHQRCRSDSLEDWEDYIQDDEPDNDGDDVDDNVNGVNYSSSVKSKLPPPPHQHHRDHFNDDSCKLKYHPSITQQEELNNNDDDDDDDLRPRKSGHHCKLRANSKQLNRLACRTQELEEFALRLREQFNQILSEEEENSEQQSSTQVHCSSINVYPNHQINGHHNQRCVTSTSTTPLMLSKNQYLLNGYHHSNGHINENGDDDEDNVGDDVGDYDYDNDLRDQDTDADSSAYTDLSQVSPVSQPIESGCQNNNTNTKLTMNNNLPINTTSQHSGSGSGGSSLLQQQQQHHSQSVGLMSSISKNSRSSPPLSSDPNRLKELHLRNRLQPSHLRSSYPVETQVINSKDIVGTLSQLTSENINQSSNRIIIKATNRKTYHNHTHNKESSVSNANTNNNNNSTTTTTCRTIPSTLLFNEQQQKNSSLKSMQEINCFVQESTTPSPLAAGYQPLPKDIQSFSEALISASVDFKAMDPNLIKSINTEKDNSNNHKSPYYSLSTNIQNVNMPTLDRKIGFSHNLIPDTCSNHHQHHKTHSKCNYPMTESKIHNVNVGGGGLLSDNENINPPLLNSNQANRRLTDNDRLFVKPFDPVYHRRQRNKKHDNNSNNCDYSIPRTNTTNNGISSTSSVQSVDELSGASSIRSSKSSIAFEIKNDQKITTVRRLPIVSTRQLSSQSSNHSQNTGNNKLQKSIGHFSKKKSHNFNSKSSYSSSKLMMTTTNSMVATAAAAVATSTPAVPH